MLKKKSRKAVALGLAAALFITLFAALGGSVKTANAEGILQLNTVDPLMLNYTLYSFVFIQSIGAGILAGFMMDGKLSSGVRYSCILGLISILVFKMLL